MRDRVERLTITVSNWIQLKRSGAYYSEERTTVKKQKKIVLRDLYSPSTTYVHT